MSKAVVVKQTPKVNPDRKRQTFSKEFKLEAVRLLERGEKPAEQLFWLCAAGQLNEMDAPYLQRHRSAKVEVSSTTKSRRRRHERD